MAWVPECMKARVARAAALPDPIYFVINKSEVQRQVRALQAAFPKTALHCFACKANPMLPVLQHLNELGMGCEAASIGEFSQAARAFPGSKLVFDSPCKTPDDLKVALYNDGGYVNVDNFQELERVASLHAEKPVTANVGIRVNCQLGGGSIGALSTGTNHSKFGIGLIDDDNRARIAAAYKQHSFLNMIHVHSGSQGLDFATMTRGIRAVVDFVLQDVEGGAKKVPIIDIGGGLSVNFKSDDVSPTFAQYAAAVKAAIPELFAEGTPFRIITEFGRAILMKAGVYLSRIEYTKVTGGRFLMLQHIGADLLLRTCYQPDTFPLRIDIYNADGTQNANPEQVMTDIAGACCFAGDLCARDRMMPAGAKPGDYIAIKDVGAYYYVSYNYYNARQAPAALFYDEQTKELTMFRRRDSVQETMGFFDRPPQ